VGSATGWDFLVTASDGVTKLNHEIESYASSTGALVAWVNVPFLSSTSDTALYVYSDNPGVTGSQQNSFPFFVLENNVSCPPPSLYGTVLDKVPSRTVSTGCTLATRSVRSR
jgi:hypothetical protein